jgi:hypothetical protein
VRLNQTVLGSVILVLACAVALPLRAQIPIKSYGQELVDRVVARNPGILVVVMHVTPPKSSDNVIIASNIGRIGKLGDEDDLRVIRTERPNLEVAHDGRRFEVELVLRDITGGNVGALGLVFPYKIGDSKATLEKKAVGIRDWLAKRILNAGNLVEPHPYEGLATTKTHAQKLLDDLLAKYVELISLAMHVTPPKAKDNIIIASNFGRIGKKADDDDLKVIATAEPIVGLYGEGRRFGVELPMRDVEEKVIGALSVGFRYKDGDDQKALVAKAMQVRDELAKRTPSLDHLAELDP